MITRFKLLVLISVTFATANAHGEGAIAVIDREVVQAILRKLSVQSYSMLGKLAKSATIRQSPEGAELVKTLTESLATIRELEKLISGAHAVDSELPPEPPPGAIGSGAAASSDPAAPPAGASVPGGKEPLSSEEIGKLNAAIAQETTPAARLNIFERGIRDRALFMKQLIAILPSFAPAEKLDAVKLGATVLRDPANAGELAPLLEENAEVRAVLRSLILSKP